MNDSVPAVPFGVAPLTGNPPMTKAEVRTLVHNAGHASERLQSLIEQLVTIRAWEVLGYTDFIPMWESENGDKTSRFVTVVAVNTLLNEGMNTRVGSSKTKFGANGHTNIDIARAIGVAASHGQKIEHKADIVSAIRSQVSEGVPLSDMTLNASTLSRRRQRARLSGASPMDFVTTNIRLIRWQRDVIRGIASDLNVPDADVYRRAIDEYLTRSGKTPPKGKS